MKTSIKKFLSILLVVVLFVGVIVSFNIVSFATSEENIINSSLNTYIGEPSTIDIEEVIITEKTTDPPEMPTPSEHQKDIPNIEKSKDNESFVQEKCNVENKKNDTADSSNLNKSEEKQTDCNEKTSNSSVAENTSKVLPARNRNSFESQMFEKINQIRKENGVTPLEWSSTLHGVAIVRSAEACEKWSHTRPDGRYFTSVFEDYEIYKYSYAGENLACDSSDVEVIVRSLMASSDHKANILNTEFKYSAIAIYTNDNGKTCVSQIFAY
jgi:uncharacterized protein YkwD